MIPVGAIAAIGQRSGSAQMANPNHYRTAFLIDATGQANGTAYTPDESRYAHALTYTNGAAILSGKFEFDGTNDVMTTAHSLLWTFGSKFTLGVMGLVFDAANTGTSQGIVCQYNGSSGGIGWVLYEANGSLVFSWSTSGTGTTNSLTFMNSVVVGKSYDVFVCWDGLNVYTRVNGQRHGSAAFTGTFADADTGLRFGALAASGTTNQFLNGRFTACFMTKGENLFPNDAYDYRSPSLPIVKDNPALTDPHWGSVIALITYDAVMNRIRDYSPYDHRLAGGGNIAGAPSVQMADGTPSMAFDGVADTLLIGPDDPIMEPGASPLTVELFTRHTVSFADQDFVSRYNATGSMRSFIFGMDGTVPQFRVNLSTNGTAVLSHGGPCSPTLGVFEHKAVSLDGTNLRFFLNGVQAGVNYAWSSAMYNANIPWMIGSRASGGGLDLKGHAAEVRITKGVARYTAGFTNPTTAFPRG